jgi:YVTN family beta-propeller protein
MRLRFTPRLASAILLTLGLLGGTYASTSAQSVVATVAVGSSPQRVAVNPTTNRVYVSNNGSNNVSIVDGSTNAVIATTPVGSKPMGVAVNPTTNRVYVANQGSNNVSVLDGSSNAVIATIAVGTGPIEVAVNPTTNRVYVTNSQSNTASVIDGASNTVIASISFASSPLGIAVNPTTNRVYVITTGAAGVLSVIDGTSNAVITTIPSGSNSAEVAVNPATNRVYVTNTMTGTVAVIDGSTNAVITNISTGSPPVGTMGIAVNPSLNHIYATNFTPGGENVVVIDGATNTVIATLPFSGGAAAVAANPSTNRFYVANERSNTLAVAQDVAPTPPPVTPTTTWFFAEGSTQPPFDTWFLIQNPTNQPATVTFTFELQGGGTVPRQFVVGPTSRFSLFANQIIPDFAFSTRIDANQPIFAERSMFVSYDGDVVTGIAAPNRTWLFAEGSTQAPFQTWLLLQNPNNQAATATITYLLTQGSPVTQTVGLPPTSRTSIFVNQVLPNQAFSSRVTSDLPIVAERAVYRFPGNAATVNSGENAPATTWYFADGNTTQGTVPFDTFLLLENPNPIPVVATVTLFQDNGNVVSFPQGLAPQSRLNVFLNPVMPNARFGIRVTAPQPIVAERSEFFNVEPRGAISTQGASALATTWNLPEGSTQPPFTEFIEVLNPQSITMGVHIDFELPTGQVIGRDFQVAGNRPLILNINQIVPNTPLSARVTTSLPSVVERIMFLNKLGSLGGTDTIGIAGT